MVQPTSLDFQLWVLGHRRAHAGRAQMPFGQSRSSRSEKWGTRAPAKAFLSEPGSHRNYFYLPQNVRLGIEVRAGCSVQHREALKSTHRFDDRPPRRTHSQDLHIVMLTAGLHCRKEHKAESAPIQSRAPQLPRTPGESHRTCISPPAMHRDGACEMLSAREGYWRLSAQRFYWGLVMSAPFAWYQNSRLLIESWCSM